MTNTTIAQGKQICRNMGYTLVYKSELNEYSVYPRGNINLAYYTDDINDAIGTCRAMYKEQAENLFKIQDAKLKREWTAFMAS